MVDIIFAVLKATCVIYFYFFIFTLYCPVDSTTGTCDKFTEMPSMFPSKLKLTRPVFLLPVIATYCLPFISLCLCLKTEDEMQDWTHFVNSLPILDCNTVDEELAKTTETGHSTASA